MLYAFNITRSVRIIIIIIITNMLFIKSFDDDDDDYSKQSINLEFYVI